MEKYDIAFSYASEQKDVILKFSHKLQKLGLKVFIDTEHPDLFVFKHVPDVLKGIYDDNDIVMLIFLSKDYIKKDFTKYEGYIAFDKMLKEKRLAIIKLDNSTLSWLPSSFFYYDINKYTEDEICNSLYSATQKDKLPTIDTIFEDIEILLKNKYKKWSINSQSKMKKIYKINDKVKLKFSLNEGSKTIYVSIVFDEKEPLLPHADIHIDEQFIVFQNNGLNDNIPLFKKSSSKTEFYNMITEIFDITLERINE